MSQLPTDLLARITALRHDLHAHPELAFKEKHTAERIATELEHCGLEVHTGIAGTGVVGVLRQGTGNGAIGLRADMDALPLLEANRFAYRSQVDGTMHACGHDGHMAMLCGAAHVLAKTRQFNGTLYFIFQPAEEHEGGAQAMVEAGLFSRFPMQYVFGMHNWPGLAVGCIAIHTGPVMAAADHFEIKLRGQGGHAAMPHLTHDVIGSAAALIQALQTLVSRNTDPQQAAVVSVARIHAGTQADNILPEEVVLGGTVRCFNPTLQDALEEGLRRVCAGVAAAYGVTATVNYSRGYPTTINHSDAVRHSLAAARQCTNEVLTDLPPSMGAEDFAYFARQIPACYVWLGNGPGQGGCMLHSPHYDFNDAILDVGINYWVNLAQNVLPEYLTTAT